MIFLKIRSFFIKNGFFVPHFLVWKKNIFQKKCIDGISLYKYKNYFFHSPLIFVKKVCFNFLVQKIIFQKIIIDRTSLYIK